VTVIMDQALPVGFHAVNLGAQHFDKIWDPAKNKYKRIRQRDKRDQREDPDLYDRRTMEEKGLVLRRRRDVGSDEEIVETVRHKGEILPRRPGRPKLHTRKASSVDGLRNKALAAGAGGAAAGALVPYRHRGDGHSDSEGSVPPRSRVRAKSTSGKSSASRRRRNASSSSSSSDTSSLGSSTDEEKQIHKMQRKKWITGALASIATIHAAQKVYKSIENHDNRILDVQSGKMSPEEAHKKARSARWQDAAAIGIAALGIRGAISEWNDVTQEHAEHKEMMEKREEHHKKRLEHERRLRAKQRGGYYKGRDGEWYYDGPLPQSSESARSDRRRTEYYEDSRDDDYRRDDEYRRDRSRRRSRAHSTVGRRSDSY
jgi:hypothetical protein